MSVIHIDSIAPAARKPNSTRSVFVPTVRRTSSTSRVPNPEWVKPADRMDTPMKNVMIGFPKPAATTDG